MMPNDLSLYHFVSSFGFGLERSISNARWVVGIVWLGNRDIKANSVNAQSMVMKALYYMASRRRLFRIYIKSFSIFFVLPCQTSSFGNPTTTFQLIHVVHRQPSHLVRKFSRYSAAINRRIPSAPRRITRLAASFAFIKKTMSSTLSTDGTASMVSYITADMYNATHRGRGRTASMSHAEHTEQSPDRAARRVGVVDNFFSAESLDTEVFSASRLQSHRICAAIVSRAKTIYISDTTTNDSINKPPENADGSRYAKKTKPAISMQ
jgi:hypothetical protein